MKIEITEEFIKIGQLLKKISIISSGGMAKKFLANTEVKVNGKRIGNRSSKVRPGDTV
jgi:ribosome-associated protein YbcJ (S4-like RNA binding protein)